MNNNLVYLIYVDISTILLNDCVYMRKYFLRLYNILCNVLLCTVKIKI